MQLAHPRRVWRRTIKRNRNFCYSPQRNKQTKRASGNSSLAMADECIAIERITTKQANGASDKPDAFGYEPIGGSASYPTHRSIARMSTERNAAEYNMNHKNRGLALIFNHEYFDIPSLKPRAGTNVDCENFRKALKGLGFAVSVHNNCKLMDILKHTQKAAEQDHSDNDCILVAILSHGELGYIYAKDVQYKLDSVWNFFTAQHCPTLAGKPKLFFIQACQGDGLDSGILMRKTETDGESAMSYKIPTHADFLFAYSTIPGFYSWRNTSNGSWFMQSLIEEINKNGKKHDILTLLTFVNQRVAVDFESSVPDSPMMHRQKQIPCVTTMLTRILRFNDKHNPAD